MAKAVTNAAAAKGLKSSWYHVTIYGDNFEGFKDVVSRRSVATAVETEEVVVTVDWSSMADHTQVFIGANITTTDIAEFVSKSLLTAYPALGISSPLATRPLHLIGHSRGGSVELETARILGSYGIWVDHVTTLDPHPLNSGDVGVNSPPGFHPGDPAVRLYENVVFADNYWRADLDPLDFDGREISGAENVRFNENILAGGWLGDFGAEHSKVYTWYHGTIGIGADFPTSDGHINPISESWYGGQHPQRDLSGFFWFHSNLPKVRACISITTQSERCSGITESS